MPNALLKDRGWRVGLLLALLATCTGLAACGSSSSNSSPTASATSAAKAPAQSTTTPAATPSPIAGAEAAAQRAIFRAAMVRMTRCMRRQGVNLPEPDASGHVDTKGYNANGPRFQAKVEKCKHLLGIDFNSG